MRRRTRVGAVAVLAGVTSLSGGVAQAATTQVEDARGDVQVVELRTDSSIGDPREAPDTGPDIAYLDLAHRPHRVTILLGFEQLEAPSGDDTLQVVFAVQGSNQQRRTVQISDATSSDGRTGSMYRESDGPDVCAAALRTDITYADGESTAVAAVSFPRRCIGSPARVRAGAVAAVGDTAVMFLAADGDVAYDNASSDGGEVGQPTARSPWVRRG